MYQFTTTTVINSAKDSGGTADKYAAILNDTVFQVTRVGNFKKSGIASVYQRNYAAGVLEKATVTIPTVDAGKTIRLTVDVRLSGSTDSEYATPFLYFRKPVTVEVIATGTAGTDAAALAKQISALKDRFGVSYITASAVGAVITFEATVDTQRFYDIKVEEEVLSPNSLIQPEYKTLAGQFTVTVNGKIGFGDDAYMIKSIMIPTMENVRPWGVNAEERPVLGGNYTQFTLRYDIPKEAMGIATGARSITNHVFYVKSDLVTPFKTELAKVFADIEVVSDNPSANFESEPGGVVGSSDLEPVTP